MQFQVDIFNGGCSRNLLVMGVFRGGLITTLREYTQYDFLAGKPAKRALAGYAIYFLAFISFNH